MDRFTTLYLIFFIRRLNINTDTWYAIEAVEELCLDEPIFDDRNIIKHYSRAVGVCQKDYVRELGTGISLATGSEADVTALRPDRTTW